MQISMSTEDRYMHIWVRVIVSIGYLMYTQIWVSVVVPIGYPRYTQIWVRIVVLIEVIKVHTELGMGSSTHWVSKLHIGIPRNKA